METVPEKTDKKPQGRGKTGISPGKTRDYLLALHQQKEDFQESTSVMYRTNVQIGWKQYSPRAVLTPEYAEQAIAESGMTLHELFRDAVNAPALNTDERAILNTMEQLSHSALVSTLELIRTCQLPWWIPLLDDPLPPITNRLQEITRRRIGYLSADRAYSVNFPFTSTYFPFSDAFFIAADDIPFLAAELDVPYAVLSELGFRVRNYTQVKLADRVFTEYKMLSSSLRPVINKYVDLLGRKEGTV